jgi:hypothetical protein
MVRLVKVITPNATGFYWEVRCDGRVIARGVADTHADAVSQATAAKAAAAQAQEGVSAQQMVRHALE